VPHELRRTDVVVDVTGLWVGDVPRTVRGDHGLRLAQRRMTVGRRGRDSRSTGQGSVPAGGRRRAMLSISNVAGGLPGIVFAVPCARRSVGSSRRTPNRITPRSCRCASATAPICVSAIEPVDSSSTSSPRLSQRGSSGRRVTG
jgi:hypothetical protein